MPSLISFVCMSFAFRFSTLHLRPVEAPVSHHRLSVFNILFLTGIIGVTLSIDTLVNRVQETAVFGMQGSLHIWQLLMSWIYFFPTTLLWFSFAWLLAERKQKRWIGFVGLAIYLASLVLYYLQILPAYMNHVEVALGATLTFQHEFWYSLTLFAITIFHAVIAFLCVAVMYWKGYRWDFYRPTPTADVLAEKEPDSAP